MNNQITYADKVAINQNSNIPDINKVNAGDMNEIKSVVNGTINGSIPMGNIVVDSVRSKNMFNVNTCIGGLNNNGTIGDSNKVSIISVDDKSGTIVFTSSEEWRGIVSDYIEIEANTQYILSLTSSSNKISLFAYYYDSSKQYLSATEVSNTTAFTTPSGTKYVRFSLVPNETVAGQITLSNILFIKGSTIMVFSPYQNLSIETGTILFEGATNQATINLYDNLSNYSYIDIEFGSAYDGYTIQRFDCSNNAFNLCLFEMDANTYGNFGFVITMNKYDNGGTSINYVGTIRSYKYQQDANWVQDTGGQCFIKKVIGYK